MDGVAQTAYYCCGVRAKDAASANPICGDTFAQRFMTPEGQAAFNLFVGLKRPNTSNAVRTRIIDDLLRERLAVNPRQMVFLVGAGFDSRAYRLGGGRWIEFDQPALLERKNMLLPVSECPVPLIRVSIDFVKDSLVTRLLPWAGTRDAIVVMEGVSMYLTEEQQRLTFAALREALPGHTLICDLMTERFAMSMAKDFRSILRTLGADFAPQRAEPAMTVQEEGYDLMERNSIIGRARELGAIKIPSFLFHTVLRLLRDGYAVHVFRDRGAEHGMA